MRVNHSQYCAEHDMYDCVFAHSTDSADYRINILNPLDPTYELQVWSPEGYQPIALVHDLHWAVHIRHALDRVTSVNP